MRKLRKCRHFTTFGVYPAGLLNPGAAAFYPMEWRTCFFFLGGGGGGESFYGSFGSFENGILTSVCEKMLDACACIYIFIFR